MLRTKRRAAARRSPTPSRDDGDQVLSVYGVTWAQYCAVRKALDEVGGLRMTYLDGMLELVTPGPSHENYKTLFARLVEIYALERGIGLSGYGQTTFKRRAKEAGLEPDECYVVGWLPDKGVPALAYEVVMRGLGIGKLKAYARLEVPEVLFWHNEHFSLHRLGIKGYKPAKRITILPDLDLDFVAKFMLMEGKKNQTEIVRAFRDAITRSGP